MKYFFLVSAFSFNLLAQVPAVPTPPPAAPPPGSATPPPAAPPPAAAAPSPTPPAAPPPAATAVATATPTPAPVEKSGADDQSALSTDSPHFTGALYQPSSTEVEEEAKIWSNLEGKTKAQVQKLFLAHEKTYSKSPRAAVLYAVYLAEIGSIIQAHKMVKPALTKFPESSLPKLIEESILVIARKKPGYGIEGLVKKRYDQYVETARAQPRL